MRAFDFILAQLLFIIASKRIRLSWFNACEERGQSS
jgi:hypothetical protein